MASAYLKLALFLPDLGLRLLPVDSWNFDPREFELSTTSQQGERMLIGGEYKTAMLEGSVGLSVEELQALKDSDDGGVHGYCGPAAVVLSDKMTIAFSDALIQITGTGAINGSDGGKFPVRVEGATYEMFAAQ